MDISADMIVAWAEGVANEPLMLALVLALATLITEDGALIAGSLLVGASAAGAPLVIAALAIGIAAGDVGLYGLGALANKSRFVRKRLPLRKTRDFRRWLEGKTTPVLFLSRFLPGTRLPTYLTFGFLHMPLGHFILVMSVAAAVWVSLMVLFVSHVQQLAANLGQSYGVAAGVLVALVMIFTSHRVVRRSQQGRRLAAAAGGEEGVDDAE